MSRPACRSAHRHSIFCVLPPHLLREIARNGTPAQRDAALATLALDQTARTVRTLAAVQLETTRGAVPSLPATSATPVAQRAVYDAKRSETLPGKLVRAEGSAKSKDVAVNEAYDGLGATFAFYLKAYGRNSVDNAGLRLDATVHYGRDYDNAFWDGRQMIFGDGDGQLFNRFTIAVDIIGHELTHGVTGYERNLRYVGQSGALNESVSDVFGALVKQHALRQTADKADWLIGAGLLARGVQGKALRSMMAPGTAYDDPVLGRDPQPADMRHYVHTAADNGGVHTNSGIPNRAFYLVAAALGGHAWERAGRIWYETLRDPRLRATCTFADFAIRTVINAGALFGSQSQERAATMEAWRTVGVELPTRKLFGVAVPRDVVLPASAAADGPRPRRAVRRA